MDLITEVKILVAVFILVGVAKLIDVISDIKAGRKVTNVFRDMAQSLRILSGREKEPWED